VVIKCKSCGLKPAEIFEYIDAAEAEGMSPDEYVIEFEGTYNPREGTFYCTDCYIADGMPTGTTVLH
jgi:hypothetical protein